MSGNYKTGRTIDFSFALALLLMDLIFNPHRILVSRISFNQSPSCLLRLLEGEGAVLTFGLSWDFKGTRKVDLDANAVLFSSTGQLV
jgi:hypothetical protein